MRISTSWLDAYISQTDIMHKGITDMTRVMHMRSKIKVRTVDSIKMPNRFVSISSSFNRIEIVENPKKNRIQADL